MFGVDYGRIATTSRTFFYPVKLHRAMQQCFAIVLPCQVDRCRTVICLGNILQGMYRHCHYVYLFDSPNNVVAFLEAPVSPLWVAYLTISGTTEQKKARAVKQEMQVSVQMTVICPSMN